MGAIYGDRLYRCSSSRDRHHTDNNPDPANLGWGIAAGIAILAAVGGLFKSITSRSAPCDAKNEAFRKSMEERFTRMEATLKGAVDHAQEAHEKIYDRLRENEKVIAVIDTRLTSCQRGLEVIKRNGT